MKIKKTILSAVLATAALGLAVNANALNADAENSCPGCHGVMINGKQAVGSGGRNCAPRSEAEWVATIDRMNGKNCGANNVAGIAKYLFDFGTTTTTTVPVTTTTTTVPVTTTTTTVPVTTTTTTVPVTTTTTTVPVTTTTTVPVTTTTTTVPVTTTTTTVPVTTTTTTVPVTTTTTTTPVTTTSTTTVATTTTTTGTMCVTFVNGITQYPYSGSGSCHGHGETAEFGHIVKDQSWCQKHMTHQNSKANHTHAYPHPTCM